MTDVLEVIAKVIVGLLLIVGVFGVIALWKLFSGDDWS
jgi:hypothetical protein